MQVIKESAARIASSTETSPLKSFESEGDKVALLEKEIADMKKRFLSVAKKKQAEYAKRVHFPSYNQTSLYKRFWYPGFVFFLRVPLLGRQTMYSKAPTSQGCATLITGPLLYPGVCLHQSAVDTLLIYP